MVILLNTSQLKCEMTFLDIDNGNELNYEWESGRGLAKDLLGFISNKLIENNKKWSDISSIGVFEGPGSFTGIRIGMTIMNTIADAQNIQIVGSRGDDWKLIAIDKIKSNINEKIVLPYYGSDANITTQQK